MKALRALCLALMLLGIAETGSAQRTMLGPKDGAGLPPTDLDRVKVGDVAPDFTLEAFKGPPITLSQFRGQMNVVLVFYRGHW